MKKFKHYIAHEPIVKRSSGSARRSRVKTSSMNKHKRRHKGLQL
jgi:hypothetical protein